MSKKNINPVIIISSILVFVVVAGVTVLMTRNKEEAPAQSIVSTATIMINEDGFVPSDIKIKQGTVVIWNNQDTSPHHIVSGPYPSHSNLEELNSKTNIATNGTYRFTFTKAGSYSYYDELNPKRAGTVIVE